MIGGGGQCDIFLIKSDHSGLVKVDGTTAITSVADRAIRIGKGYARNEFLMQSDFTIDDDGKLNVTLNHTKFDSAWNTFLKLVVSRTAGTASAATEEVIDETGYKGGGAAAASTQDVLLVSYGAKDADGKIPVIFAVGNILKSSGGLSFQANTFGKPTFSFQSKACQKAGGLVITAALDIYNGTTNAGGVLAAAATATLDYNNLYDMAFLTPQVA